MNGIVMKFGGTSVADRDAILRLVRIVDAERQRATPVVVVSAMSGVTDQLLRLAAEAGRRHHRAIPRVSGLGNLHTQI